METVISINPCIRCGKERIKGKEKTVVLNATQTKITFYICPDKECQKIVDKELGEKEAKKLAFANRRIHVSKKEKPPEVEVKDKK